jgi:hypothetical protein
MGIEAINKKIWVYDLETLDLFTATFIDRDSDDIRTFVFSKTKDERPQMFEFLSNEVSKLIGYNCLHFDAQILEYMYRYPDCTPQDIRNYARIITSDNERRPDVPEWKLRIPHLDLYKVNHFDNKNRRTGLKWCEFGMDLDNIEDMPSQGDGENWEEMVLSYNLNDVIATKELLKYTEPLLSVRRPLSKMYRINCMNYSNTKLGSEILLKLYCEKTNRNINDVRSMRTYRPKIIVKDIIFPYIKFKSLQFQNLLKVFEDMEISGTKKDEEILVNYKNFDFVYGKGGIHGSVSNKLIESNDEFIIIDADVASLYPSIAIANNLYPRHLGKDFCDIYKKEIVDVRLAEKAKKELGNKAIVEGFKEAANATYGNSNQIHSWLYDPQYTMATTINGQLMLTMLAEELMEIPNSKIIQINTDGLTLKLPKNQINKYYEICNNWMSITNLLLEYAEYSKMVIFDVNNYLAVSTTGKVKTKGRCEFENIPLHKNKSHCIIPRAFHDYWVKGVPVEQTIKNHRNIFDFCAGVKAKKSDKKGASHYEIWKVTDGEIKKQKLSKTVRYYICKTGGTLLKFYEDGTHAQVEAPIMKGNKLIKEWKVAYFNKACYPDEFEHYEIDYVYYISKAKDWINDIEQIGQIKLI